MALPFIFLFTDGATISKLLIKTKEMTCPKGVLKNYPQNYPQGKTITGLSATIEVI